MASQWPRARLPLSTGSWCVIEHGSQAAKEIGILSMMLLVFVAVFCALGFLRGPRQHTRLPTQSTLACRQSRRCLERLDEGRGVAVGPDVSRWFGWRRDARDERGGTGVRRCHKTRRRGLAVALAPWERCSSRCESDPVLSGWDGDTVSRGHRASMDRPVHTCLVCAYAYARASRVSCDPASWSVALAGGVRARAGCCSWTVAAS